jgi:hypothetical protein
MRMSLLVIIALSGCTTYWKNPNPQANWDRDHYECQYAGRGARRAPDIYAQPTARTPDLERAAIVNQQTADRLGGIGDEMYFVQACLRSRGWRAQ